MTLATPNRSGQKTACEHCGEPCGADTVRNDEGKQFCCAGCQTVYHILHQHNLTDFYKIDQNAAFSLKGLSAQFDYLDDPEIHDQLIDFTDGQLTKVSFHLPKIHCASCLWLLERLPQLHEGIRQARVNFMRREIYVTFSTEQIRLSQVADLLTKIGYKPAISLDSEKPKRKAAHNFILKIGVTGFCTGNIMLLSFPEYLGISGIDDDFIRIFGTLNLVLIVPIFFFGAGDYFKSAWKALAHGGLNIDVPIALGILALAGRSFYEIFTHTGAGYLDSLAGLIFFLLLGKWFQQKTYDHISFERDYKSYFPLAVTVIKEGKQQHLPLNKLKRGDMILVKNGELIPADARLIRGEAHLDYSFITGESDLQQAKDGDLVYAGGRQRGTILQLQLVKEVNQSYLTQLWTADAFQKEGNTSLQNLTDRFGQRFTVAILIIATVAAAYWWWALGVGTAVNAFTSVLIVACPCALALNVPFALGNALRVLARHQFYLKDTATVERMVRITHAIFDKTGTITEADTAEYRGEPLDQATQTAIFSLVSQSSHPVSRKIYQTYKSLMLNTLPVLDYAEQAGGGISASVGGRQYRIGHAGFVGAEAQESAMSSKTYLAIDGQIVGYFALSQGFRSGVSGLISRLKQRLSLSLISGDHAGEESRIREVFGENVPLHFRQSPHQKLAYVQQLQQRGEKVMMVGDGLNDAGALKQADIGLAVSEDVHSFSPACDGIIAAPKLGQLDRYLRFVRQAVYIVYLGFGLSLVYNVVGLSFAVRAELAPIIAAILMPISSITVVASGVLLTNLAAWQLKRG